MKEKNSIKNVSTLILILIVVFLFVLFKLLSPSKNINNNSVYEKVVSSGVLRACYAQAPPAFVIDPNTGEFSGIFHDALSKAAENMDLKVEWVTEVGWGDAIQALDAGKCDIVGSNFWANTTRGKSAEFSQPLYYDPINAYVRVGDNRFDENINIANDPKYTVITMDGEASLVIANQNFSKAKTVELTQLTDTSQLFVNLADKKGDITFQNAAIANLYTKNNPGKIKALPEPVVVYGNVMMMKKGEITLKTAIDNALTELLNNGYIDTLIDKYTKEYPGEYRRVALPYR